MAPLKVSVPEVVLVNPTPPPRIALTVPACMLYAVVEVSVPPLPVMLPEVSCTPATVLLLPARASVPPDTTTVEALASTLLAPNANVPALIVVVPVYVFAYENVSVPAPLLVTPAAAEFEIRLRLLNVRLPVPVPVPVVVMMPITVPKATVPVLVLDTANEFVTDEVVVERMAPLVIVLVRAVVPVEVVQVTPVLPPTISNELIVEVAPCE